jgi:hypothetical protein
LVADKELGELDRSFAEAEVEMVLLLAASLDAEAEQVATSTEDNNPQRVTRKLLRLYEQAQERCCMLLSTCALPNSLSAMRKICFQSERSSAALCADTCGRKGARDQTATMHATSMALA